MFSFRTTPLFEQPDHTLNGGKVALLCNDTAWDPKTGKYFSELASEAYNIIQVFTPDDFSFFALQKAGADALIVEVQDTGDRFSSFPAKIYSLFKEMKESDLNIAVYLIDRINPSGRVVEGTMLSEEFYTGSYVEGLPFRHGLTLGELANMFYSELNAKFPLHIVSASVSAANKVLMPWSIPPQIDFAGFFTPFFHAGQYLWNGTNINCGEGTLRKYEFFGAPFMKRIMTDSSFEVLFPRDKGVFMRKCQFTPLYGRYVNETCYGYQLIPNPSEQYNSVIHSLRLIRFVLENFSEAKLLDNMGSLAGDQVIMTYISGKCDWDVTKEYIKAEEQKWLRKAKKFLLYDDQLFRIK